MKYPSGGGTFAKFDKPGDKYTGRFTGSRMVSGKFGPKLVVDLLQDDGTTIAVDLGLKALETQWNAANAARSVTPGERLAFEFEKTYDSPKYGKGRGKDVTIDFLDRTDEAPAKPEAQTASSDVEAAYDAVVKAKGADAAKAIRAAVEGVAKGDPAKQAELLRKAVAA